jgi:hypothetical protein
LASWSWIKAENPWTAYDPAEEGRLWQDIHTVVGVTGRAGTRAPLIRSIKAMVSGLLPATINNQRLGSLEKQKSLAQLTATESDDRSVAQKLVDFWQSRLGYLRFHGGSNSAISEAAGSLLSAKSDLAQFLPDAISDTTLQRLDRDMAFAQLTSDMTDDVAVQRRVVSFWEKRLGYLRANGGSIERLIEAATSLKSARDTLSSLRGEGETETSGLLAQQLLAAQQRFAISQAQYGVLDQFQQGTGFVPQTGPYMLHRGEAVIPANQNGAEVVVYVNGDIVNVPSGRSPVEVEGAKAIVQRGSRGYGRRPLPGAVGR